MFTDRDLYNIAAKVDPSAVLEGDYEFGYAGQIWTAAGARYFLRFGAMCQCSRRAKRRGCWHAWHEYQAMLQVGDALADGVMLRHSEAHAELLAAWEADVEPEFDPEPEPEWIAVC